MHPTRPAQLLDHRAAERLNLAVLKRIDLAIEEVCTTSVGCPLLTKTGLLLARSVHCVLEAGPGISQPCSPVRF